MLRYIIQKLNSHSLAGLGEKFGFYVDPLFESYFSPLIITIQKDNNVFSDMKQPLDTFAKNFAFIVIVCVKIEQ